MRIYFAPMEGITGHLYRQAHQRWFGGVDRYYMPFISPSHDHIFTKRERRELDPANNQGLTAVPQLLTKQAEDFLWAAGELAAMGYEEVNLNLGCPSGTVTAKGKGAGFLAHPEELDRFLTQVFSDVPLRVSVKTRLGMTDPAEFERLLAIYNKYPIFELTIHARVRSDFYKVPARMDCFEACWRKSKNPVCYNGDLVTAGDCIAFGERFPAIGAVMVGQGLIADPALARKVKGGPRADKKTLEAFHDELYEAYCTAFGSRNNAMLRMKELWIYFINLFEDGEKYSKKIRKSDDTVQFENLVSSLFRDLDLRPDARHGW